MDKVLSIIVPAYNMEKYLPKCLSSLVVDTELMDKFEVLVVNDGSTDRTSEIAHDFATKYSHTFRVIDKENGNYGSCVNAGLQAAQGTYVFVLDADDYVQTEAFGEYIRVVESEATSNSGGVDLIVSNYIHVSPSGDCVKNVDLGLTEAATSLQDKSASTFPLNVHSNAYKRSNLCKIRYRQLEGMSYTDTQWMTNPMILVKRLRYFKRVLVCYLIGRAGQTMEDKTYAKRFQQIIDITRSLLADYEGYYPKAVPEAKEYYQRQVLRMIDMVYRACIFGWNGFKTEGDLTAFDKELKKTPDLYALSDKVVYPSNFFPFSFVHEWRKRKSTWTLRFIAFKGYVRLMRFKHLLSRH